MKIQIRFSDGTQDVMDVEGFQILHNCLVLDLKDSQSYIPLYNVKEFRPSGKSRIQHATEKVVIK